MSVIDFESGATNAQIAAGVAILAFDTAEGHNRLKSELASVTARAERCQLPG